MNLQQAVHALVRDSLHPAKKIAVEAGVSYGYLMKAADEMQPEFHLQAKLIAPLTKAAVSDVLIEQIAEDCGGVFYRLAPAGKIDAATANTLKEFSEYLSALADAQGDQKISVTEYFNAKKQAMDSIRSILSQIDSLRVAAGVAPEQQADGSGHV